MIIKKMPKATICLLNLITGIIFVFFITKILIFAQNQNLQKNYYQNYKNKLLAIKIFSILKNFKNKHIIRVQNQKARFLIIKFG